MPAFLKIPRLNRRLFQLISGILWILFLVIVFVILKAYAPPLNANLPVIMKFIMNIVDLRYYLLGFAIFLMLGFSYAYIGRLKDAGISPWIALIPLIAFYGLVVFFAKDLLTLLQESNLLFFIAKMKKFMDVPTIASFQGLFSSEWIVFIAEKKRWIDVGIMLYLLIVLSAMLVPSQAKDNRFGGQKTLSTGLQLFSILLAICFWLMTIAMLYLGGHFLMMPNPVHYLENYDQFMQLLSLWQGA